MGRNSKKPEIIETAENLFMRFGMKRVTVKEICQKSGVSKMTFYNHFSDKNDLIKHIFNAWLEQGYDWIDELEREEISFREEIKRILEYKKNLTSKMSPQFINEYLAEAPELEEFFQEYRQRGLEKFIEWIESCKKQGKVRKSIKPEFLVHVFNMSFNLMKDAKLRNIYPELSDLLEEVFEFLFYGIIPRNKENGHEKG